MHCDKDRVKAKIEYIEGCFKQAHDFAFTQTGSGLKDDDEGLFHNAMIKKYPWYFNLLPIFQDCASSTPKITGDDLDKDDNLLTSDDEDDGGDDNDDDDYDFAMTLKCSDTLEDADTAEVVENCIASKDPAARRRYLILSTVTCILSDDSLLSSSNTTAFNANDIVREEAGPKAFIMGDTSNGVP